MKPKRKRTVREPVEALIPSTWLDPLLTGPKAVIGQPPYGCQDIEKLLNALRELIRNSRAGKRKRTLL